MTRAVDLANSVANGVSLGFKNRIINGAMVIDQRNAGASVTPTATVYGLDRWKMSAPAASKYSFQRNAGSVTPPAGFTNYLGVTSLSAYSITSTDAFLAFQLIEGYNVADLAWGTANAQTITLSFWVRSSLTGTFGGALGNVNATRSYPFSYTISSANTWEQKTITIAGDTTGTWNTTNSVGLALYFGFGVGSTYSGTAGAWVGSEQYSATGATSVVGTNGATFYITGVQLEAGSTATNFEYRDYGRELMMCQRYYEKSFEQATAPANGGSGTTFASNLGLFGIISTNRTSFGGNQIPFKVAKRTTPTITKFGNSSGNWGYLVANGTSLTWSSFMDPQAVSENGFIVSQQVVDGTFVVVNGHWTASAEL